MAWFDKKSLRKAAPWVIGLAVLVAFGWRFIKPGPPSHVTISAGSQGGAYFEYAKKYAAALEKNGVKTTVLTSSGSLENIKRLKDETSETDIAFVQSGLISETERDGLVSLGSLYFEPMWIFYRTSKWTQPIDHITALKGSAINTGTKGSGTEKLALQILDKHSLAAASFTASSLAPQEAATALKSGSIDAMMLVSAANAPVVEELLTASGIAVMSLSRAEAITRILPALAKVTLPRGSVNLSRDIPLSDVTSVASTATLVSKEDLHPAIAYLLIKTANELHGGPQLLSGSREFPSITKYQEFEVPEDVDKLYKQGAPVLYKHMPFWLANLLYRLWVLLIPLGAAMITLSDALPKILGFRGNRQIAATYADARVLEQEALNAPAGTSNAAYLARLDGLHQRAARIKVPSDFVKSLFELRGHLDQVAISIAKYTGSTGK